MGEKDIQDDRDPDCKWRLERTAFDIDSLFNFPYCRAWQDPRENPQHAEVSQQPEGSHGLGAACNSSQAKKQDDKDQILEALFSRLLRYGKAVPVIGDCIGSFLLTVLGLALLILNKISGLHQTSPSEQQNMIETLRKNAPVNGDSWQFLKLRGDFVSTRADRAHEPFESLIHDDGPIAVRRTQYPHPLYIILQSKD